MSKDRQRLAEQKDDDSSQRKNAHAGSGSKTAAKVHVSLKFGRQSHSEGIRIVTLKSQKLDALWRRASRGLKPSYLAATGTKPAFSTSF